MVPSWVKSGGAHLVAGYTVERSDWNRGVSEHLLASFFSSAGRYTFGQAYYLSIAGTGGLEQKQGFCLYGDPAWDARLKPRRPPASWQIAEREGTYTVTIDAPEAGDHQQYLFLPHWLQGCEAVAGREHVDFTADNYISVHGTFPVGRSPVAVFRARRVGPR